MSGQINFPIICGIILTAGLVAVAVHLGTSPAAAGYSLTKFEYLISRPLNEIGDALAGIAGALAFVWLTVAVFLQKAELRAQRTEWEKISESLSIQASIFREEQKERAEIRANKVLLSLIGTYLSSGTTSLIWGYDDMGGANGFWLPRNPQGTDEQTLLHLCSQILQLDPSDFSISDLTEKPTSSEVDKIIESFSELAEVVKRCSESKIAWARRFQFDEIIKKLSRLRDDATLWATSR